MGRPRAVRFALLLVALAGGACTTPLPPPPAPLHAGYRYVNRRVGVALSLPAEWHGFAKRGEAPAGFENLMPASKGRDESPLLIGVDQRGQAFVRVLVEPVPADLSVETYFRFLVAATGGEAEPLSASFSAELQAVRWSYRVRQGPLEVVFRETLAISDGWAIRVGFWSLSALAHRHQAAFSLIEADVLLHRENGWQAPFAELDASLDAGAFSDLEYAEASGASGPPPCAGGDHSTLWSVETEHGTMFLFGSVHFGHPDFYPFAAPIEDAFAAAQTLVVELDTRTLGRAEKRTDLTGSLLLPDGRQLSDEITPELYARVSKLLETLRLPVETFSRLTPASLALSLTEVGFQSLGYVADSGVDSYFLERSGDREIVPLETVAEQLDVFRKLDGDAFLADSLGFLEAAEELIPRMVQAWRCGDDATLAKVILAPQPGTAAPGSPRELVFSSRNRTMADRLEPLLRRGGDVFVVVGAGHLLGEDGVPALLEARGYRVERR